MNNIQTLYLALGRLAKIQRVPIDLVGLRQSTQALRESDDVRECVRLVTESLHVKPGYWHKNLEKATFPVLAVDSNGCWLVGKGIDGVGNLVVDKFEESSSSWTEKAVNSSDYASWTFCSLRLQPIYDAAKSPVLRHAVKALLGHKLILIEVAAGGAMLAVLGILVSFYSMQVYDRVIPNSAMQTLLVLTLGVVAAILLEYLAKLLRSRLYDSVVNDIDQNLARVVFARFQSIRLDQIPNSVGTLAGQLRGYESVRAFLLTLTSHVTIDAPFAIFFIAVLGFIAGPLLLVPLVFFFISIGLGFVRARKILALANSGQQLANQKVGLLVESIEAAETIKSGQGGWRMLSRWLNASDEARSTELEMRHINEGSQYLTASLQQASYVCMVAVGAIMVTKAELTVGSLIACSILSGRILSPITQLGYLVSSWASCKASLQSLDGIWKLKTDFPDGIEPVVLEQINGSFRLENVKFSHGEKGAFEAKSLKINAGEKIGVIGPVGSGKTTFLRLLSGMFKASEGQVYLDDIDITLISKSILSEKVGYLSQEGRLVSGTLRDNLVLGMIDPGDDRIISVAKFTGLYGAVIDGHPSGLSQPISEGGGGLSSGQKQLVQLTRAFLREPKVWLLDEPTASLDTTSEVRVCRALEEKLGENTTLVLVTHRLDMLRLVNRVIVVVDSRIVMDGPKEQVLQNLKAGRKATLREGGPKDD